MKDDTYVKRRFGHELYEPMEVLITFDVLNTKFLNKSRRENTGSKGTTENLRKLGI